MPFSFGSRDIQPRYTVKGRRGVLSKSVWDGEVVVSVLYFFIKN